MLSENGRKVLVGGKAEGGSGEEKYRDRLRTLPAYIAVCQCTEQCR